MLAGGAVIIQRSIDFSRARGVRGRDQHAPLRERAAGARASRGGDRPAPLGAFGRQGREGYSHVRREGTGGIDRRRTLVWRPGCQHGCDRSALFGPAALELSVAPAGTSRTTAHRTLAANHVSSAAVIWRIRPVCAGRSASDGGAAVAAAG